MKPITLLSLILLVLLSGCDDDDDPNGVNYEIPSSYDFANVNYDGQLQRISQLAELGTYLKTANAGGIVLDADRAAAMYANEAGADWNRTYDASKELRGKTLSSVQEDFDRYITTAAEVSARAANAVASSGQAGVATSLDGTKTYLLDENGLEWAQVVEKGLMGACFYYQAAAVYLGPDRMNVDNETVVPGEGTEMEHHWDEAFGYLGVPTGFPADQDGLIFWGKYCNDRDQMIGTNAPLMEALIKGRAAISNQDLPTRDEAIGEVRDAWETVVAATAIHYLNGAINNFDDLSRKAHALSEAVAFVYSLQFNPEKSWTNTEIEALLTQIGGAADFYDMNFHDITVEELESAREDIADRLGLTGMADQL